MDKLEQVVYKYYIQGYDIRQALHMACRELKLCWVENLKTGMVTVYK